MGKNAYVRAGLRFAPLLLLSPARSRSGVAGAAMHPAVMGGVAVAGIVAAGELLNPRFRLLNNTVSFAGAPSGNLVVTDRGGQPLTPQPVWSTVTSDATVLTITKAGTYTAHKARCPVVVTATPVGGKPQSFAVTVGP